MKNNKIEIPYEVSNGRWIVDYSESNPSINGYCISHDSIEPLVDDEECRCEDMTETEYQDFCKKYGSEVFTHEFQYSDDFSRIVHDTYFTTISQAISCAKALEEREV